VEQQRPERAEWTEWAWNHLAAGEGKGFTVEHDALRFIETWQPPAPRNVEDRQRPRLAPVVVVGDLN
jgi:hypothetical protein